MSRRRKDEPVNHDRWLVSYADFITLLFAFFVVLYAASKADSERMKKVAESLSSAFAKAGAPGQAEVGAGSFPSDQVIPNPATQSFPDSGPPAVAIDSAQIEDITALSRKLEEILSFELGPTAMGDKASLIKNENSLIVRLSAKDFFVPGSAQVKEESLVVLKKIALILKDTKYYFRIEGHTDSGKVQSQTYASNWELSSARAAWVVRFLVKNYEFDPSRIEAAGMAEFHPIASNESELGKSRNRRIEIIVINKH